MPKHLKSCREPAGGSQQHVAASRALEVRPATSYGRFLVHLLRIATLGTAFLLVASFPLVACSGGGDQEAAATAKTTTQAEATTEQTTTETGPPPITPSEERWVGEMTRLAARMNRVFSGTKVFTNVAMVKVAKAYSACLPSLRRAGDPGRFRPAAHIAQRACEKLNRAGSMMKEAVAIQSAGIDSQTEADKYNALVNRALEAQGNGVNEFERAKVRAQGIGQELG